MREFFLEHWWAITGIIAAALFATFQLRRARTNPARVGTRTFSVDQLRKYSGTYARGAPDVFFSLVVAICFVAAVPAVLLALEVRGAVLWMAALVATVIAAAVGYVHLKSVCILGPDQIAFVSPISRYSWSVPTSAVTECILESAFRLRVRSQSGSFSLLLPLRLGAILAQAP